MDINNLLLSEKLFVKASITDKLHFFVGVQYYDVRQGEFQKSHPYF